MIHIGFTGTSEGITKFQSEKLCKILSSFYPSIVKFHHGDCIGADADFHKLIRKLFPVDDFLVYEDPIVIHPPVNPKKREFCKSDFILPERPYLDRNKDIVNQSRMILACPKEKNEVLRSGTWSTVRYARKKKKMSMIFLPDGTIDISSG